MIFCRILLITLITAMTVGLTAPAYGWDGERKGLLAGISAGFGFARIAQTRPFVDDGSGRVRGLDPPRETRPLIGTDVLLGYAPSNNIDLFVFSSSSWMNMDLIDPVVVPNTSTSTGILNQLTGFGLSYYKKQSFLPSAPAGFVTAGVGLGMISPSTAGLPTRYGPGFMLGGGYEFKKHIRAKLAFQYINVTKKFSGEKFSVIPWTVKVTIGVLGY